MEGTNFYTLMPSLAANHYSAFTDDNGYVLVGKFDTVATPDTDANRFQKGCQMTKTDAGGGTAAIYQNTGTLASPTWTLMDVAGAGGITQLTGDVTAGPGSGSVVTSIAAGVIVNADVNASAAIAFSKLAALPSAEVLVGSAGNVATAVAVTGDVTISNAGVTAIAADTIVNADVNSAAAIAFSKLATLTSANILVGSAGNVATAVAMSGDAAISNVGAVTVTDLTITGETAGDILFFNGTNWVKLSIGTAGQVLTVN